MKWTPERVRQLTDLRAAGRSFTDIAELFGMSYNAVIGAYSRRVRRIVDTRINRPGIGKGHHGPREAIHQNLIEPWAEFTARKRKERAEAKAAALQVTSVGQEPD